MGFSLLPRRAMARRGLMMAALGARLRRCPSPSSYLLTRGYSNKLFVGGLSFRTDEDAVRRAFSQHGEVLEVKLISDRETGRPKGFGFVTFESEADAETARTKMTGQLLDGRVIRVDKATSSRPPLPSSGYSGFSSSCSPSPSALPPVAEDWGTIPSNVVDVGAAGPPGTPAVPVASSTGFGLDTSNPFDSSTFGQAAASWPASTPASQNTTSFQTGAPTSASSSGSIAFGSATGFNTSVSSSSFGSNSFSSAVSTPSSSPSAGWPGSAPASSGSVTSVSTTSNNFTSSTFGSAATAPLSSSVPVGLSSPAQSSTISSNTSFVASTFNSKPFDRSTFGSASSNASTFGSSSPGTLSASATTNTSSAHTTSTTVSYCSGSTSTPVPGDTLSLSSSSTVSTSIGTLTNSSPSGTLDVSKPLESTSTAGPSSTASASTAPSTPSAHPLSSPALTSSGTFDFSNFSFNSSSYRDNDPPLPRRRPRPRPRPAAQTISDLNSSTTSLLETRSPFGSNNQFAETSIPKPKGTEVDFGLLNITAPCPPGMRPQGVFDIYIPDDLPEIPPPEPKPKPKPMSLSMFPHRQLPPLDAPYHTPEADNWSEIGKDPPKYDLSTLFPSMGELIKKDKEFHWDPFDFDPEATLPPEEVVIIIDSDYDDPA